MAFLDMGRAGSIVVRVKRGGVEVEIDGRRMSGYDSSAAVAWGEVWGSGEPAPSWELGEEHLVLLRTQVPWRDAFEGS